MQPDVILLDLDMPEMTGIELCYALQNLPQCANMPVIFLTASKAKENRLMAFQAGAVGYLNKPMDATKLLDTVAKYVKVSQNWKADQTKLEKQGASPENKPALLTGFPGFKQYLHNTLGLEISEDFTPERMYFFAGDFGLSKAALAELLAQFIKKDYLATLAPEHLVLDALPAAFSGELGKVGGTLVPSRSPVATAAVDDLYADLMDEITAKSQFASEPEPELDEDFSETDDAPLISSGEPAH